MFGQSLLSAFGSAACTTDTNQLFGTDVQTTSVATYQLNNATTSIPSNTYPGTPSNITYAAGKFGNAAVFNGSSSKIDISATNSTPVDFSSKNFTISAWINGSGFTTDDRTIISKYSGSNNTTSSFFFDVRDNDQKLRVTEVNGTSALGLQSAAAIPENTWTHVVYVRTATTCEFFINGASSGGSQSRTTPINQGGTTDISIGERQANKRWIGKIDQVRIFNSALPQSAVTALYNETTTTATYPYVDYVNANPNSIAYYKMSDATDQLGNYNGTATNVNFNTEGKFGFAGAFNGSSSSILLPNDILSSDFSISTWFYLNNTSGDQLLFEFDHENRVMFRVASTDSNKAYIGNSGYFDPGISFSANQWYHFVLTFSNGNPFKIYVNNVLSYTGGNTNTNAFNNDNIFGAANVSGGGSINGKIDQIRIYDSAISAANVTTLYNEIECPPLTTFYTSLNPSDAVNGSLSSGNLRFTSTTTPWSQCRTVQSVSSGKYYFEMYVHSATNNSLGIGIADASLSNSGSLWGQAAGGIVYYGQNGNKFENTASGGFSSTFGPGSWLMCAFDMDAGKLWFGLNGNWIGANPSTGNSPASSIIKTYITNAKPFANAYYAGNSVEMNFGNGNSVNANTFKYTPPTGFDGILA